MGITIQKPSSTSVRGASREARGGRSGVCPFPAGRRSFSVEADNLAVQTGGIVIPKHGILVRERGE